MSLYHTCTFSFTVTHRRRYCCDYTSTYNVFDRHPKLREKAKEMFAIFSRKPTYVEKGYGEAGMSNAYCPWSCVSGSVTSVQLIRCLKKVIEARTEQASCEVQLLTNWSKDTSDKPVLHAGRWRTTFAQCRQFWLLLSVSPKELLIVAAGYSLFPDTELTIHLSHRKLELVGLPSI